LGELLVEAFGPGPWPPELVSLGRFPGALELIRTSPDKASVLLQAIADRGITVVRREVDNSGGDLEGAADWFERSAPSVRRVVFQGDRGPVAYNVMTAAQPARLPQPGLLLGPTAELDDNGAFFTDGVVSMPQPSGKHHLVRVPRGQPIEAASIPIEQLRFPDGRGGLRPGTAADWPRVAVFGGHGSTHGFTGLDTRDAARLLAEQIVARDRARGVAPRIDTVLIDACSQGDRRGALGLFGQTNAQAFAQALDDELRRLGHPPVKVLAAEKGGFLYSAPGIPARLDKKVDGDRRDPGEVVAFVPVDRQLGTAGAKVKEARLGLAKLAGGATTLIAGGGRGPEPEQDAQHAP
jgi:hypothetical protein